MTTGFGLSKRSIEVMPMIIETHFLMDNGTPLVLHKSDDPTKAIQQVETGDIYVEAVDLEDAPITYVEIDMPDEMHQESNGE